MKNKYISLLAKIGVLFTVTSLPLVVISCKTSSPKNNKPNNQQNVANKIDISTLTNLIQAKNDLQKQDILQALQKTNGLNKLTESDFDFKIEKKANLLHSGKLVVTSKEDSKIIKGQLSLEIEKLKKVEKVETKYSKDKTEVLVIGYDENGKISRFAPTVNKVPEKLPEEIISLNDAFRNNNSDKIQNLDKWDTSNIVTMWSMFQQAKKFNQDLSGWNTKNVTDMSYMFNGATNFNGNLSNWNTENVKQMRSMFEDAKAFNQNISSWSTGNVENMKSMFKNASKFNQDLSGWNTKSIKTLDHMFFGASEFNSNIFKLNKNLITDMSYVFYKATKFNKPLEWDVSKVVNMNSMFNGAHSFNQDITNWDVSSVKTMKSMFSDTDTFNQDIKGWKVENVTDMERMFQDARSFKRDISNWNVQKVNSFDHFSRHLEDKHKPKFEKK
ncbi:BspA family leucine-rich repeat surface protein [Mycoplasma feriruminatoris]|uniref:BspA family leucine-rich repeat surface protein n=1 Tax=Mycoplasma feriruminatoris TaxID=1179777 RepID=A0AAQ3DNH5_9MOLU|nr:BspA family leucine-rich repeat surface protein [Mycoplasma feriruminatoris]WFQ95583.1 BspA family leucine-rich repeat surface protein [Mycoplasma feriruminatoris]